MDNDKKHKKFLKYPEFPGGKEEFKKYIKDNLVYPKEALENKIEGVVFLNAEINDNGIVTNVNIEKGLGYGCDEEAKRLLSGCKFGKVKNRGVRVKTKKKFRINFKLPQMGKKITYSVKKDVNSAGSKKVNTEGKYTYSIKIQ